MCALLETMSTQLYILGSGWGRAKALDVNEHACPVLCNGLTNVLHCPNPFCKRHSLLTLKSWSAPCSAICECVDMLLTCRDQTYSTELNIRQVPTGSACRDGSRLFFNMMNKQSKKFYTESFVCTLIVGECHFGAFACSAASTLIAEVVSMPITQPHSPILICVS